MSKATILCEVRLLKAEGFRSKVYLDTTGHKTVGYGCNLDAGISEYAARCLMIGQVHEVERALLTYWWFLGLDDARASVLVELGFWIGLGGLLHFPLMLASIAAKDWQKAHDELLASKLAKQVPGRTQALAAILLGPVGSILSPTAVA